MFSYKSFVYRDEPELSCNSEGGENVFFSFGASSMQGWRRKQEDEFKYIENFYGGSSYLGVFDGHGGSEVAVYLKRYLHQFILGFLDSDNDVEWSLFQAFLSCDLSLKDPETVAELNAIIAEKDNVQGAEFKFGLMQHLSALLRRRQEAENIDSSDESRDQNDSDELKESEGDEKDQQEGTSKEKNLCSEEISEQFCEGVAGPSQGSKEKVKDSETVHADTPELSSDQLSESVDDPSEEDEKDNSGGPGFQVLKYLMVDELEASDPEDESYDSEDEESLSDDDCVKEPIPYGNEDLEMEPGVQSGSTATVLVFDPNKIYIANVGDTRCVYSRNGKAYNLSVDHIPDNEEENRRILNSGAKIEDGRINGGLNLSRAFGDFMYKRNSIFEITDQAVTCIPHIQQLQVDQNLEFIIIASDGIWNSISSQDVVDYVHIRMKDSSLADICEELFKFIVPTEVTHDGTGCDNMTCIILKPNKELAAQNFSISEGLVNREKNEHYWHFYPDLTYDEFGPSTSRGSVIQMAANDYVDDDSDDCQIIFEQVHKIVDVEAILNPFEKTNMENVVLNEDTDEEFELEEISDIPVQIESSQKNRCRSNIDETVVACVSDSEVAGHIVDEVEGQDANEESAEQEKSQVCVAKDIKNAADDSVAEVKNAADDSVSEIKNNSDSHRETSAGDKESEMAKDAIKEPADNSPSLKGAKREIGEEPKVDSKKTKFI